MMAGLLLARGGVETLVLEKHNDFLRDFRGDTVHPSTLEVIYELGLLDDFLRRPHQEVHQIRGRIGATEVTVADFSHTPTHCHFIAFMPQWEFLNFLAEHARRYRTFQLKMEADVTGLIEKNGCVTGIRANTPQGVLNVQAGLVIGADGRQSAIRAAAHLEVQDLGSPIDVLWMRLTRKPDDPPQSLGYFNFGRALVLLNRDDYWQCAFVIRKGELDEIRAKGMPRFHQDIARIAPFLADRVDEIRAWSQISLLTVRVDRLRQWWRPGLLCIGDAAHAMSPVGGVGINLAIQDAVAAANILAGPLKAGTLSIEHLQAVQRRRTFPTKVTQQIQVLIQEHVLKRVLGEDKPVAAPWLLRLFNTFPVLRRIPARAIGVGVRPEHVRTKSAD
jgi:2-polyprenyl-6-methoxyphenol hydroxylase-like FAD-dependent oxidoreductase